MDIETSRLRPGEIIAAASAVLLLVFMFALPWYEVKSAPGSAPSTLGVSAKLDGWQALTHVRWLIVVTIIAGLALAYFQATRPAPAIPVSLSVIVTVLGLLASLVLVYRVLINVPGSDDLVSATAGAYLGLLSALGILYGGFASMRQEGISPRDAPTEIETVRLGGTNGS
jgi:hypothetical protein